jgi:hypothetical protein
MEDKFFSFLGISTFSFSVTSILFLLFWLVLLVPHYFNHHNTNLFGEPILKEPGFKLEKIVDGLTRPTGITFLGPNDFLVIEEDTGKVKRVIDGQISQTVLDVDVSTDGF